MVSRSLQLSRNGSQILRALHGSRPDPRVRLRFFKVSRVGSGRFTHIRHHPTGPDLRAFDPTQEQPSQKMNNGRSLHKDEQPVLTFPDIRYKKLQSARKNEGNRGQGTLTGSNASHRSLPPRFATVARASVCAPSAHPREARDHASQSEGGERYRQPTIGRAQAVPRTKGEEGNIQPHQRERKGTASQLEGEGKFSQPIRERIGQHPSGNGEERIHQSP